MKYPEGTKVRLAGHIGPHYVISSSKTAGGKDLYVVAKSSVKPRRFATKDIIKIYKKQ